MTFWQSLLHTLGFNRQPTLSFHMDSLTLLSLKDLAHRERRQPEELAADLFFMALEQRQVATQSLALWQSLTPREQEVAALVCLGFMNQTIASRLTISPETVKCHIANILRKFGVRHKSELCMALADWDFSAWEGENGD